MSTFLSQGSVTRITNIYLSWTHTHTKTSERTTFLLLPQRHFDIIPRNVCERSFDVFSVDNNNTSIISTSVRSIPDRSLANACCNAGKSDSTCTTDSISVEVIQHIVSSSSTTSSTTAPFSIFSCRTSLPTQEINRGSASSTSTITSNAVSTCPPLVGLCDGSTMEQAAAMLRPRRQHSTWRSIILSCPHHPFITFRHPWTSSNIFLIVNKYHTPL